MIAYIIPVIMFLVGLSIGLYCWPYREDKMIKETRRMQQELQVQVKRYSDLHYEYSYALQEITRLNQKLARTL